MGGESGRRSESADQKEGQPRASRTAATDHPVGRPEEFARARSRTRVYPGFAAGGPFSMGGFASCLALAGVRNLAPSSLPIRAKSAASKRLTFLAKLGTHT